MKYPKTLIALRYQADNVSPSDRIPPGLKRKISAESADFFKTLRDVAGQFTLSGSEPIHNQCTWIPDDKYESFPVYVLKLYQEYFSYFEEVVVSFGDFSAVRRELNG